VLSSSSTSEGDFLHSVSLAFRENRPAFIELLHTICSLHFVRSYLWQTQFIKLEKTVGIERVIEEELKKSQRQVFHDVVGKGKRNILQGRKNSGSTTTTGFMR
jgi:hypothetical protein